MKTDKKEHDEDCVKSRDLDGCTDCAYSVVSGNGIYCSYRADKPKEHIYDEKYLSQSAFAEQAVAQMTEELRVLAEEWGYEVEEFQDEIMFLKGLKND